MKAKLTRYFIFLALFVILAACSLQGNCDDPMGCIKFRQGSAIQIGVEVATVGEQLESSIDMRNQIEEMFLAENAAINTPPFKLVYFDTTCNPEQRVNDAARIITYNLAGFIGPVCESGSGKFEKMISDAGILSISSHQPPGKIKASGYFSFFPSIKAQAAAIASIAKNNQPEIGFLVIHQESIRVIELAKTICEKLMNCKTTLWEEWLTKQEILGSSSTLLLFLVNQAELDNSNVKISQGRANNYILFDPGLRTSNTPTTAENRIQRILPILPTNPGSSGSKFYSTLAAKLSLNCLLTTIQEAAETNPDGSISVPRQAIRLAFAKKRYEYQGLLMQPCPSGDECSIADQLFRLVPDSMQ